MVMNTCSPACKWFLTSPLPLLLKNAAFRDILNFEPLPAAGVKLGAGGSFTCTGGPTECDAHKYMSCAIEEFPDVGIYYKHISCLEGTDKAPGKDWPRRAQACFSDEDLVDDLAESANAV